RAADVPEYVLGQGSVGQDDLDVAAHGKRGVRLEDPGGIGVALGVQGEVHRGYVEGGAGPVDAGGEGQAAQLRGLGDPSRHGGGRGGVEGGLGVDLGLTCDRQGGGI